MAQFVAPMMKKWNQTMGSLGSLCRPISMMTPRVRAPRSSRDQAT